MLSALYLVVFRPELACCTPGFPLVRLCRCPTQRHERNTYVCMSPQRMYVESPPGPQDLEGVLHLRDGRKGLTIPPRKTPGGYARHSEEGCSRFCSAHFAIVAALPLPGAHWWRLLFLSTPLKMPCGSTCRPHMGPVAKVCAEVDVWGGWVGVGWVRGHGWVGGRLTKVGRWVGPAALGRWLVVACRPIVCPTYEPAAGRPEAFVLFSSKSVLVSDRDCEPPLTRKPRNSRTFSSWPSANCPQS